jgi:DNA repair protein RadA
MVDSPHHPEEEVIFALGEAGVVDAEETEKKTKKTAIKKETKKTTKKIASKETVEAPKVPLVETPEIITTDGPEQSTVETPDVLALSEALDEEFSDSAPTDV